MKTVSDFMKRLAGTEVRKASEANSEAYETLMRKVEDRERPRHHNGNGAHDSDVVVSWPNLGRYR